MVAVKRQYHGVQMRKQTFRALICETSTTNHILSQAPQDLFFVWKFVSISSKWVGDLAPSLTDTSPSGGHLVTNPLSQSLWGQAALSESPLFCLRKRKKIARKRYMQPRKNGTKYIGKIGISLPLRSAMGRICAGGNVSFYGQHRTASRGASIMFTRGETQ